MASKCFFEKNESLQLAVVLVAESGYCGLWVCLQPNVSGLHRSPSVSQKREKKKQLLESVLIGISNATTFLLLSTKLDSCEIIWIYKVWVLLLPKNAAFQPRKIWNALYQCQILFHTHIHVWKVKGLKWIVSIKVGGVSADKDSHIQMRAFSCN